MVRESGDSDILTALRLRWPWAACLSPRVPGAIALEVSMTRLDNRPLLTRTNCPECAEEEFDGA